MYNLIPIALILFIGIIVIIILISIIDNPLLLILFGVMASIIITILLIIWFIYTLLNIDSTTEIIKQGNTYYDMTIFEGIEDYFDTQLEEDIDDNLEMSENYE